VCPGLAGAVHGHPQQPNVELSGPQDALTAATSPAIARRQEAACRRQPCVLAPRPGRRPTAATSRALRALRAFCTVRQALPRLAYRRRLHQARHDLEKGLTNRRQDCPVPVHLVGGLATRLQFPLGWLHRKVAQWPYLAMKRRPVPNGGMPEGDPTSSPRVVHPLQSDTRRGDGVR